tara:strand:- start:906 stop:1364 length:459 start_codon:yes stop_codon:yes gene_type:complete
MARRKGRKTQRRRRKSGISILGVAETVALSNVATQTLFNTNAYDFLMGGSNFAGANQITLRELMNPMQSERQVVGTTATRGGMARQQVYGTVQVGSTMAIVQQNLQNNWMNGAIQMVTIPLAFRFGKQLARPAINKVNALLRKAGVASTVKV